MSLDLHKLVENMGKFSIYFSMCQMFLLNAPSFLPSKPVLPSFQACSYLASTPLFHKVQQQEAKNSKKDQTGKCPAISHSVNDDKVYTQYSNDKVPPRNTPSPFLKQLTLDWERSMSGFTSAGRRNINLLLVSPSDIYLLVGPW